MGGSCIGMMCRRAAVWIVREDCSDGVVPEKMGHARGSPTQSRVGPQPAQQLQVLKSCGSALSRFPDIVAATEKIHKFETFNSSPLESARMYVADFFPIATRDVGAV